MYPIEAINKVTFNSINQKNTLNLRCFFGFNGWCYFTFLSILLFFAAAHYSQLKSRYLG